MSDAVYTVMDQILNTLEQSIQRWINKINKIMNWNNNTNISLVVFVTTTALNHPQHILCTKEDTNKNTKEDTNMPCTLVSIHGFQMYR